MHYMTILHCMVSVNSIPRLVHIMKGWPNEELLCFSLKGHSKVNSIPLFFGGVQTLEWTTGLDYWNGLLE